MRRVRKANWFALSVVPLAVAVTTALAAFSTCTAQAAFSQWEELGGGKVRLVAIKNPADDTLSGIVEVRLDEGWKTYWRAPGSSGIPPEFDFSRSNAVEIDRVEFPAPVRLEAGGSAFYGYKKTVSFPFQGRVGSGAADIRLSLLIGICEEICIPATANLVIAGDDLNVSDSRAQTQIMLAKALMPQAATEKFRAAALRRDENRLELEIHAEADGGAVKAVIWPATGGWISDPQTAESLGESSYSAVFDLPAGVTVPDPDSGQWAFALIVHDAESQKVEKTIEGHVNP